MAFEDIMAAAGGDTTPPSSSTTTTDAFTENLKAYKAEVENPQYITGDTFNRSTAGYEAYNLNNALIVHDEMDKFRAMQQSTGEQAAVGFGGLLQNIAGGLVKQVGQIGALVTEWGDNRDYNNAIIEAGEWIQRNNLVANMVSKDGEGQIYMENPNAGFLKSINDPAYWISQGTQGLQSLAEFGISGMGMGTLVSKGAAALAAKGIARFATVGTQGVTRAGALTRLAESTYRNAKAWQSLSSIGANAATASTLAYLEGAGAGKEVFDATTNYWNSAVNKDKLEVAKAQYEKDNNLIISNSDFIRMKAAQGAASAAQLSTILNTFTNMISLAPLFRSGASQSILSNEISKLLVKYKKVLAES